MNKKYSDFYDQIKLSEEEQTEMVNSIINKNEKSKRTFSWGRRRVIFCACSVTMLVLVMFNFSTCIAFCKSAYNGFLGIISVNDKLVSLDEAKTIQITVPEDMEEMEYNDVNYKSKVYESISEMENELGIDLLQYPFTKNASIVLQIQDDRDVLIHIQSETNVAKEPEMVFMNFSILSSGHNEKITYDDDNAQVFLDEDGNINMEELGNKYDIVATYKSENLGVKIAIVKDTLTSNNDMVDQDTLDVYYNAIFVYENIVYRICMNGTENDIRQCIEKLN